MLAIFATALLIDFSASWEVQCIIFTARVLEYAVATAIIPPGLQKLQGVASFSAMFLNYDLHAQRQVPFSYVYLHPASFTRALIGQSEATCHRHCS